MINEHDSEMPDDAIWRAAAESEEVEGLILLLGMLQVEVDESPDHSASVVRVAREFPSLAGANGLEPWAPDRLEQWIVSGDSCSTSGHWSAMLILSLWEGTAGQFPVEDAWTGWDVADQRALRRVCGSRATLGSDTEERRSGSWRRVRPQLDESPEEPEC